jgi:uncharacterized ferritin-like protein (DUF455 family)
MIIVLRHRDKKEQIMHFQVMNLHAEQTSTRYIDFAHTKISADMKPNTSTPHHFRICFVHYKPA